MNKYGLGILALGVCFVVGCTGAEKKEILNFENAKDIKVEDQLNKVKNEEEIFIGIDEREMISGLFEGEFPKQIMSPLSRNIKMAEVGEFFVVAVTNDENATWKHELLTNDTLEYVGEGDYQVSHYYGFRVLKEGEANIKFSFRKEGMPEYDKDLDMSIMLSSKAKSNEDVFEEVEQSILTKKEAGNWNLQENRYLGVVLEGNATTGYGWEIKSSDEGIVSVEKDEYITNNSKMMGAPGKHHFLLKANKKGIATIKFEYKRSWEKDVEPIETIEYKIFVDTLMDEVSYSVDYSKENKELKVKMFSNVKDLNIEYTSGARFDIVIKKGEEEVYNYLKENMFNMTLGNERLNIGDSVERSIKGLDLEKGEYTVQVKTAGNLKDAKPYSFNINVK
ncbi:MAG: protease inhibitor I42 family protein [Clostridia bacterium]|jgi:predicted secreted protein|nr:protease inhibitor I42 family protein [Clostridia bacterium]